ncbi:general substrate transporter [Diplogelasinospora grovesii]|uniref:General substrate transporter n=1 Tax=Diplogelasinospora grovesii TaxID=303347 RepID=A0AAN6NFM8_9PEZI|nr:general substrate transporter [Diplogelasinospora grovesii]
MPFAFEWIFLGILLTAITFAPESPYWYLERDRTAEAYKQLKKLVREGSDERAKEKLALMQHTLQQEEKFDAADEHNLDEQPLWRRCLHDLKRPFSGVDVRRTEIACVAWIIQAMCGSSIIGWAPTLFVSAGLPPSKALSVNIGLPSAGILGTLASWWLMRKMGRRTIYLWGLLVMAVLLVLCGAAAFAPGNSAGWIAGGVLIAYTAIYDLTIGPVCYSIVSEIPSIRLRAPTLAKARGSYLLVNLVNGFLTPKMVGTDAESWGWGSKTGFFYAVMCLLGFVYTWYRIPETKDLSARALDILFQHRAKTREFSNWKAAEFEAIDAEEEESKGTNHRRSTISVWPSATHSS